MVLISCLYIVLRYQVQLVQHTSYLVGIEQLLAASGRVAKPSRRIDMLECIAFASHCATRQRLLLGRLEPVWQLVGHVKEASTLNLSALGLCAAGFDQSRTNQTSVLVLRSIIVTYHSRPCDVLRLFEDAWPPNIDRLRSSAIEIHDQVPDTGYQMLPSALPRSEKVFRSGMSANVSACMRPGTHSYMVALRS